MNIDTIKNNKMLAVGVILIIMGVILIFRLPELSNVDKVKTECNERITKCNNQLVELSKQCQQKKDYNYSWLYGNRT